MLPFELIIAAGLGVTILAHAIVVQTKRRRVVPEAVWADVDVGTADAYYGPPVEDRVELRASRWTVASLLFYLAVLTAGELAVVFVSPLLVFPFHGGVVVLAAIHLAWVEERDRDEAGSTPALVPLLLAFILAPLIRLISLTLPLSDIEEPYRYLFAGIPMALGALVVARSAGLRWTQIGLQWRGTGWQVLAILVSVELGFLEFIILQPEPVGPLSPLSILPALSVGLATGIPEELIFRGVMQTAARPLLGSAWSVLYVSGLFAVLHIGYASLIDVAFVFAVALFYGAIFERTRSIIGVSIGHGVANVILFFVAPNILNIAKGGPLP